MSVDLYLKNSGLPPRGAVVLLHGYGADRHDLSPLAQDLSALDPFEDIAFLSLDAPFVNSKFGIGREWFALPDVSLETCRVGLDGVLGDFEASLTHELGRLGLGVGESVLFGFSQGGMMALGALSRFDTLPRGVLGYSTFFAFDEGELSSTKGRCPVCLIHGEGDDVVPFELGVRSASVLKHAGFDVSFSSERGLGHGISPSGLRVGAAFLGQCFGKESHVESG